jgi:hypothetical protein
MLFWVFINSFKKNTLIKKKYINNKNLLICIIFNVRDCKKKVWSYLEKFIFIYK